MPAVHTTQHEDYHTEKIYTHISFEIFSFFGATVK